MGLLSDYADINGGAGGLLGVPQDASAYMPQTSGLLSSGGMSDQALQALLASMGSQPQSDASASLMPQTSGMMTGGDGAPDWYNAAPTMGADPSSGAPQLPQVQGVSPSGPPMVGRSGPPPGQAGQPPASPPQLPAGPGAPAVQPSASHGGLLGNLLGGVAGIATLPFKVLNAYGAAADAVPRNIAFQQTEQALKLRAAVQNQALIGGLLGNGAGGLFGGGVAPSADGGGVAPGGGLLPSMGPQGAPVVQGRGTAPTPVQVTPPVSQASGPAPGSEGARGFATPPSPPNASGSSSSTTPTGLNIRDPNTQRSIAALELLGNPAGAQLATLGSSLLPKYSAIRPGGALFNEATGQINSPTLPDNGTQNIPNGDGTFTNVPVSGAVSNAAAMTAGNEAAKATVAQLYGPKTAGLTASAVNAADAPYKTVTVPMSDGSTRTMPLDTYVAGVHGAGGAASARAGLGVSQTPAAAQYATDQSKALSDVITQDQVARQPAMIARDNGLRALTVAQNTAFNPAAPARYEAEKIATIFGIPSQDADKVATYQQIANQSLLSFAKTNLPSRYTERELNFTKTIYGQIHDPNSAALIMAGTQAAVANKAIARADYASAYNPASGLTRQQYEAGWAKTPAGQQSIYQDPVFQGIKIGGRPAVVPFTNRNGQPRLAVTPGLGTPTIIPAY